MSLKQGTPFYNIASYVEGLEEQVDDLNGIIDSLVKQGTSNKQNYDSSIADLNKTISDLNNQIAVMVQPKADWEVKADNILLAASVLDALNIPYVFGGESKDGMDCSGFTQFLYKNVANVNLPRVSKDQATTGQAIDITDMSKWQKGDLIAFDYSTSRTGVDHIGIYMGNGKMIHTNTPATGINIKSVSPTVFGLVTVRRVL